MKDSIAVQPELNKKLFNIIKKFGGTKTHGCVEFFFYTDAADKATNLAIELAQLKYEIYGISPPEEGISDWSVIGATHPMCLNERELTEWCKKMNQLGFETDCSFDGWGALIE